MTRSVVGLALLAGVLAACGSSDKVTAPVASGTYTATVSGAVTGQLSGRALFGTDAGASGQPIFGVLLGDAASPHAVLLYRSGNTQPAAGTYALQDSFTGQPAAGTWTALHMVDQGSGNVLAFFATSGSMTITQSSATRLSGTFNYVGKGYVSGGDTIPEAVTVTGNFDATASGSGLLSAAVARAGLARAF